MHLYQAYERMLRMNVNSERKSDEIMQLNMLKILVERPKLPILQLHCHNYI